MLSLLLGAKHGSLPVSCMIQARTEVLVSHFANGDTRAQRRIAVLPKVHTADGVEPRPCDRPQSISTSCPRPSAGALSAAVMNKTDPVYPPREYSPVREQTREQSQPGLTRSVMWLPVHRVGGQAPDGPGLSRDNRVLKHV